MLNWNTFFITVSIATALFAESKFEDVQGKVVLKDKDGKSVEIKNDTKISSVDLISTSGLDKLVLKNQFQLRLITDKKEEVTYDVVQESNKDQGGRIDLKGFKENNKQDLAIKCFVKKDVKTANAKYEKTNVACVKSNSSCKTYVLNSNKKFKLEDTALCTGKKEVEKSAEPIEIEEKTTCWLMDDLAAKEKTTNYAKFTVTKLVKDIDYKNLSNDCK